MTWELVKDRYRHADALSVPLARTGSVQQGLDRLSDMKSALDGVRSTRSFYEDTEAFASAVRHALAEGVDLVLTTFGSWDEA